MVRVANAVAAFDLGLELIITSPLVRAQQTATIVADKLKMRAALTTDDRLGPNFGLDRLAKILSAHRKASALMLVGHEPGMSTTVGQLIGGAAIDFKKGSLACVDLTDASRLTGTLLWLVPPRVLVR